MFNDLERKVNITFARFKDLEKKLQFFNKQWEECKEMLEKVSVEKQNLTRNKEEINNLIEEKTKAFPWLASAIADYYYLESFKVGQYLAEKSHPAKKSSDVVKEQARVRREAEKKYRITKYYLEYYHKLFPWLVDFQEADLDDLIISYLAGQEAESEDRNFDRVSTWLTKEEYSQLSTIERNQMAFDRYLKSRKTPWQIGRDYEMYCGFCCEKKGYSVAYQGIVEGFEDLGRDLIAENEEEILVIQCKYWSQNKNIREKHIVQLYGTAIKFKIEIRGRKKVKPVFMTSTKLSEKAKEFANELGVIFVENYPMEDFPRIKCNINAGEKIYHLPFDQQYDRTLIKNVGEFYAYTVKEAEDAGFRRAFRWRGEAD